MENDYVGELSTYYPNRLEFLARRSAAYRAFYEHLPLPARMRPDGLQMRIHTEERYGSLARFFMLDGRQYRSTMRCDGSDRGGGQGADPAQCPSLKNPARSFLGADQFSWLKRRMARDGARWTLFGQPTVFSHTMLSRKDRNWLHTDSWDGYPIERERLLQLMSNPAVANPVVFSGDVHVFYANRLHRNDLTEQAPVGTEFVCSGITSPPPSQRYVQLVKNQRESVRFANSQYRGYLRVTVNAIQMTTQMMAVENALQADSEVRPLASFVVENGRPAPISGS